MPGGVNQLTLLKPLRLVLVENFKKGEKKATKMRLLC
jgi:hypothetical protein